MTTTIGALLLLSATGALVVAARAIARWLLPSGPTAVQWTAFGLVGCSLLVVLSQPLLFLRCYEPVPLTAAAVVTAVVVCWRLGTPGFSGLWSRSLAVARAVPRAPAGLLVFAGGGFMALFAVARGLLLPPLSWDSLTYHMTLPAFWVQNGGYGQWQAPDVWQDYCHYPGNGELLVGWLLLPFHGDLLVNLINVPFLFLIGAGAYALARELGADRAAAMMVVPLLVLAPPCFAYATSQYVDVQVAAEVVAGWLFLVRFLRTGARADCVLAAAGFGLAAGTKHLALVASGIAALVAAIAGLRRRRQQPLLRTLVPALAVGLAVSAAWYVRNWIETGNPVFPFSVAIGGLELFAASANQGLPAPPGPGNSFLAQLFGFPFGILPLTFGPVAAWAIAGGALGIALAFGRGRRGAWAAIVAAIVADLAVFFGPQMTVVREHWGEVSQRLLLPPFALLLCAAAFATGRLRALQRTTLNVLLTCLVVWDIAAMQITTGFDELVLSTLVSGLLLAFALAVLGAASRALRRPWPRALAAAGAAVALLFALDALQQYRDRTRHDYFAQGIDSLMIHRNGAAGWRAVDQTPGRTIAYAAGWQGFGHHWLVYPLFGSRLQNQLVYVPWTAAAGQASYRPDQPTPAPAGAAAWIERLRAAGVEWLYIGMPAPPELAWAEAHPQQFVLRSQDASYRLYEFR